MVGRDKAPRGPSPVQGPVEDVPWSMPVSVGSIPDDGRHFDLVADATVRAAIVAAAGDLASVQALPRLEAHFDLTRQGADGLRVTGKVTARVEQACVVTLEPLESDVREDVDLLFLPASSIPPPTEDDPDMDPPEPLVNGNVDLGRIATDFLILGIDLYPRKTGVTFESPLPAEAEEKPFAALAALKKDRTGDAS
jgi:uncharacterized metal-binding protein YceD (DUF177 family)